MISALILGSPLTPLERKTYMSTFNRLGGNMDEANAECAAMDEEDAQRKDDAHMASLISAVKNHAKSNYNVEGWDYVVECYEDTDIAEIVIGAATTEEAIRLVRKVCSLTAERRQEARAEGGCDMEDKLYAEEELAHIEAEHHGVSYLNADELTGYEEHLRDEQSTYGDGRRCPRHPNVVIGSPCGMFDGVCGECEYGAEMAYNEEEEATWLATQPKCGTLVLSVGCDATGAKFSTNRVECQTLGDGECPWWPVCEECDDIPF